MKGEICHTVEYTLTALGTTLREPLAAICAWAAEHA
jgi:DNA-binding HxlR family transcriptional regulator